MNVKAFAGLVLTAAVAAPAAAQPSNDLCTGATVVSTLPFDETIDTSAATNDGDPSFDCAQADHSVWYRFTAGPDDVILVVDTYEGSPYRRTITEVYTGTCGALSTPMFVPAQSRKAVNASVRVPAGETVLVCVGDEFAESGGLVRVQIFEAPEFLVEPDGYDVQFVRPAVGATTTGDFFVVWSGYSDVNPSGAELRGRKFALDGTPLAGQVVLDDTDAFWLDVAPLAAGEVVVAWDDDGIELQRIDATGAPVGGPTVANQTIAYGGVGVDSDAGGNFVVVWDGPTARLFDATATPLGSEFSVSTTATGAYWLDVGRDDAGNFVVVWEAGDEVWARRFDATGTPAGAEFAVSTGDDAYRPVVASTPAGEFLVVWEAGSDLQARAYDASGVPQGAPFQLTPVQEYTDHRARIAADDAGTFVVAWEDDGGRSDSHFLIDVKARRLGTDGTFIGPEFLVNTVNDFRQYKPDVAAAPGGEFMVAWTDYGGEYVWDDDGGAIVARGFPADAFIELACPAIAKAGCRQPIAAGKATLTIRNDTDDQRDLLALKWTKGEATPASAFGDPTATDAFVLCLYDESSSATGALLHEVSIPAGGTCATKPCWKAIGTPPGAKGFKYKDKERTPHGVGKAVFKPGAVGRPKLIIKAAGNNLATSPAGQVPTTPLALPVRAQVIASTGECWEATFPATTDPKNTPSLFRGKSGQPD